MIANRVARWCNTFLLAALIVFVRQASGADRIILRNLDVISDRSVTSFDLDGITLDNGKTLGWDEVEKASLANSQEEFDAMLKDVGTDLYRIRQRLTVGDYAGLAPHAEALWPRYQQRRSQTAFLVFQSLMWARMVNGQREEAVEPYLASVECLRKGPMTLPGERKLRWDPASAMSDELVPLWFRPEAAQQVLPRVGAIISTMEKPWPPGARIYYATLAVTAGESDRAAAALAEMTDEDAVREWPVLIQMQREVQQGRIGPFGERVLARWSTYTKGGQIAAHYWIGRVLTESDNSEDQRRGLLHLLRLPALYGEEHPEIAAAGLHAAMLIFTKTNDPQSAVAVRTELLQRYGQTKFAEQVQASEVPNP